MAEEIKIWDAYQLLNKQEQDLRVFEYFYERRCKGDSITKASFLTMGKFNILSPATVYHVRKRVENYPGIEKIKDKIRAKCADEIGEKDGE